ncbi:MAG: sigma-70 family RNA polymerase sigma factor [Methylomonas sp.]|jgi:RNA polymerase sigma factor (sigma-70 family)
MALRDDYAISETQAFSGSHPMTAAQTAPRLAFPAPLKAAAEAQTTVSRPHEPSSAVSSHALALEMEEKRRALLDLLLRNPQSRHLLTTQFTQTFKENLHYSLAANDTEPQNKVVQSADFVQSDADTFNADLHIYPVVLIRLASQMESVPDADSVFCAEIQKSRKKLEAIRQKMIVGNKGLVAFLAFRYKTSHLSIDDLHQEGMIGLIRAVDRFEAKRGVCFSTYAVFWIKQAISRLVIKQEKVVRLPMALAEKAAGVFEIMRNHYLDNQSWPSLTELQSQCGLPAEELKTISNYFQATHSLDASVSEEQPDHTLLDNLQQQQFPLPEIELINNNLALHLGNIVASLPAIEAAVLNMRFGLKNHTEMTLQAIADQFNLTRERVRQIQNQGLKKLKQQFGNELAPFLESYDH